MQMLSRLIRHLTATHWRLRRLFPAETLRQIESAVADVEATLGIELRFAIESALPASAVLRGITARERALAVFADLRVWDTERNSGVLIYVLLADRAVEIVADRGVSQVGGPAWQEACQLMQDAFHERRYRDGALQGIAAVARCGIPPLSRGARGNEMPDTPVLL